MRYFIGFLVTVGLIILLIILLFGGHGKPKTPPKTLSSYASTDAEVSMLIDGPINAASEHQQILITVGRDNVTYEQLTGYDGQSVNTQTFANTQSAYDAFLHALQHAGFMLQDKNPALQNESGYCALSDRYIFEIQQDNDTVLRSWYTSCGTKTYLGAFDLTLSLFEAQVPGYEDLTAGLQL